MTSRNADTDHIPCVVIAIEGNGYRPSHHGDGYSEGGYMYTLNSVEIHAVCYEECDSVRTSPTGLKGED